MKKIHTREKRKMGLSHNKSHKKRVKKNGPKTFKAEASARKYAESLGLKKYELVNLKTGENKKLKVVPI
ncbi:hypothetical protein J4425_02795 [Candidatus Woesearchaeota archaeon]|nr:hypothetical protein [Candidatus Woesearchaeota archaeon]